MSRVIIYIGMQTRKKKAIKKELENNEAIEACAREFGVAGDATRLKVCYLAFSFAQKA